ncbi:MAG: M3 family metallopeptidase, partial [Mariprofundaceae bacterium]|nr:M3 family metallopeptidase [Mariprofundaceae bacterium]
MNALTEGLTTPLPLFQKIHPDHVLPALDEELAKQRQTVKALVAVQQPSWSTVILPLENMDEALSRIWGPVSHLNAVCDSDTLREVYQQGAQKISAWHTELAQNEALFTAMKEVFENHQNLTEEQCAMLAHSIRDFRLSGSELKGEEKARFKAICLRLSELATTFEQHVLDATRAFTVWIEHEDDLSGLPESALAGAAQRARHEHKQGWLFTLDMPSYLPVMQYADNRTLRETMYTAFSSRASSGDLDNSPVIDELLALRKEQAQLLGFESYSDYSIATKMADTCDEVVN